MKLVYSANKASEVKVGDEVTMRDGVKTIVLIEKPRHGGSTGRVYVKGSNDKFSQGYYPSVVDAEWIDREDQE